MESSTKKSSLSRNLDCTFYRPADEFFQSNSGVSLTYDDVSLATLYSEIVPREANLETLIAPGLPLHLPVVSSDMDTVTESRMAIATCRCEAQGRAGRRARRVPQVTSPRAIGPFWLDFALNPTERND